MKNKFIILLLAILGFTFFTFGIDTNFYEGDKESEVLLGKDSNKDDGKDELDKSENYLTEVKENLIISSQPREEDRGLGDEIKEITDSEIIPSMLSDQEIDAEIEFISNVIESSEIIKRINNNSLDEEEKVQVKELFSAHDQLYLEKTKRLVKELEEKYDENYFIEMEETITGLKEEIEATRSELNKEDI